MRRSRLFAFAALTASFGWLLAGGCSSSDDKAAGGGGRAGSGGSLSNLAGDGTIVTPDAADNEGGAGSSLNMLCGVGECVPDDATACDGFEPSFGGAPAEGGAGSSAGGAGGSAAGEGGEGGTGGGGHAGADGDGGTGGDEATGEGGASGATAGSAGAGNGAGEAGQGASGASGGTAGSGGSSGGSSSRPRSYGCQVIRENHQTLRQCQPAGAGKESAPCFSAADCSAGFACVTEGEAGRCLPYCCAGDSNCGMGTYCAERPLRTSSTSAGTPRSVPVCVPADDCSLEEEFPCPPDKACRCRAGTACMVVRGDGTTACLPPGSGLQGDPCPCAWNYVCSSTTGQCVKICHTDPARDDCGAQKCQASSELPQNFGVCVGPLK